MIELYDILPTDLKETFQSLDYEVGGSLIANTIKYLDNELLFDFTLFLGGIEQNENQIWQLQILNCLDSKISIENLAGYFNFYSDHFLLWEFLDNETELYFKKGANNPEKLLADIYSIHNSVFDNHIPLEKFLNGNSLLTLCRSGHGLFARGPKRILKYYFDCLTKAGKEPYYLGDNVATKWDNKKRGSGNKDLKVALIGGTFFIGSDFKFKRLDK